MSSDSSTNSSLSHRKGPKVNTTGITNLGISNPDVEGLSGYSDFRRYLGRQYDGDRQLYDVLGYDVDLDLGHYVAKYERGPGIATAVVDKPVHDCWGGGEIEVEEAEETDVDETNFETEARKFLNGEYTRISPVARFRSADKWARLLEFSLIFIGVDDENVQEGDIGSLEEPVDEGSINDLSDINFIAVYDQKRVNWTDTKIDRDPTSTRYRLPKTYNVDIDDDTTADLHHSRVIHVVENPGENELKSPPLYRPIFNRLEDLQKLLGGSAEMFWRSAYPGLVLTPPTDENDVPMKFSDSGSSVAEQISEYRNNLDRTMRVTGNLEKLDTDVASPTGQIDVQIQDISAYIDMPMSIIRGNETGERATQEDRRMYHEFIGNRRNQHCEYQILKSVFDRLLGWGAMPSTASGDEDTNSYVFNWPTLEEQTEQEEADTASSWASAFKAISGGNPAEVASASERRKKLGMDPQYGSEAPDVADPEELAAQNLEVPEDEDVPENV